MRVIQVRRISLEMDEKEVEVLRSVLGKTDIDFMRAIFTPNEADDAFEIICQIYDGLIEV